MHRSWCTPCSAPPIKKMLRPVLRCKEALRATSGATRMRSTEHFGSDQRERVVIEIEDGTRRPGP